LGKIRRTTKGRRNVQRKSALFFVITFLGLLLIMGCRSGPVYTADAEYRDIERESQQAGTALAITGAEIALGVDQIDQRAARVAEGLAGIEAAISGSSLADEEKGSLLRQVTIAQGEAGLLSNQVTVLHSDAERLNAQLARQRVLEAVLSEEHGRREAAAAGVQSELEETRLKLEKTAGQRNLYLVIMIILAVGILGFIAVKVLRFLRVIP
jgi:hypothetical protein